MGNITNIKRKERTRSEVVNDWVQGMGFGGKILLIKYIQNYLTFRGG